MEGTVILIVEDDPDILTVLKDQLEMDGYRAFGASTGEEGLAMVREVKPHLVILDLNLPDTDGLRLCREMRRITDVPIIMLTVRDSVSDKLRGFEVGADDYVTKPFEYLELAAGIRACLRRSGRVLPPEEEIDLGRVKILPYKREVFVDNRPVKLTRKEYELLELLVSHRGKVLSRDFIKSKLWKDKVDW